MTLSFHLCMSSGDQTQDARLAEQMLLSTEHLICPFLYILNVSLPQCWGKKKAKHKADASEDLEDSFMYVPQAPVTLVLLQSEPPFTQHPVTCSSGPEDKFSPQTLFLHLFNVWFYARSMIVLKICLGHKNASVSIFKQGRGFLSIICLSIHLPI